MILVAAPSSSVKHDNTHTLIDEVYVDRPQFEQAIAEATSLVIMDDEGSVAGGHLADFHAALIAKGTTTEQADPVRSRELKLITMIKAKAISQLTPSAVQIKIAELRDSV